LLKVLLVTGVLAQEIVAHYAKESKIETEVFPMKVQVAAFLSPESIAKTLGDKSLDGFDSILVPGLIRGDVEIVTETTGISTFKGPRYAADLPVVLDALNEVKLSTTVPACELLQDRLQKKALEELEQVEKNKDLWLKRPGNLLIGNLAIGRDFPMRIMAEIVDAALMPVEEVQQKAKHFVSLGADIIDVGMVAGESRPADAGKLIRAVKQVVDVPVSIDTLDPIEIREAIMAGADMVLSGDGGNLDMISPFAKDVTVVLIPTNQREGYFPKNIGDRVEYLENLITKARKLGFRKMLGDLVLEPSNVLSSLMAFHDFAFKNPDVPLFIGVSNVTELMDADSVGINALLARISSEIGASVLLATEKSVKARGTVKEEVTAAKMMFLAKKRGSVPKDLGIDLLLLKDKRNREENSEKIALDANVKIVEATEEVRQTSMDKKGCFRIMLDRSSETIFLMHYTSMSEPKPSVVIKGKTAESLFSRVLGLNLISQVDHAAYLGVELSKSEIALRTGKEYIQDEKLF
jgi:dihydropteroate synthase-like protein